MAFGTLKGTLTFASNNTGATNALTGSVSIAVGDLVYVHFAEQTNVTATGATDNLGNTYSKLLSGLTSSVLLHQVLIFTP